MPEHIRALAIVIGVAVLVFWFAKQSVAGIFISESDYKRDRNLWLAVTCIVFLSHSFWLYVIVVGLLLIREGKRHENPLALYCLLLMACPDLSKVIPGVGPIRQIIVIDQFRLFNLALLLPIASRLYKTHADRNRVPRTIDLLIGGLITWMFCVQAAASDSITDTMRSGFYLLIDIWIPYYVGSRALNELRDFYRLAVCIVIACTIVAIIAVFESSRHWMLYSSLRGTLGVPLVGRFSAYVLRGEGGPLRAQVSLGNAIAVGYVITVALAMAALLYPLLRPAWKRNLAVLVLVAGLIASLSRGPWVGCAIMLLTMYALGPGLGKRIMWGIFGGGAATLLLLISPWGDTVVAYLPFVGTVESDTVDYRAKLFDVSMKVFNQHPIVGDFHYLSNPLMEQMRQGQGIIDMVNTYLQYALPYGSIGIFLFAGTFVAALWGVKRVRDRALGQADVERLGRTLIAMLIGILITIATVSSISVIPTIYWLTAGICASYIRIFGMTGNKKRAISPSTKYPRRSQSTLPVRSGQAQFNSRSAV